MPLSRRTIGLAVLAPAPLALLFSACASAPPPEPPRPAPTPALVVVPTPSKEPTAEPAPPPPPPPEIGSAFQADPLEPLPPGAVARCGTGRMRAASPRDVAVSNTGSIFTVDYAGSRWLLRDVTSGRDIAPLENGSDARFAPNASFVVVPSSYPAGLVTFYAVPSGARLGEVKIPLPKPPDQKGRFGVLALLGSAYGIRSLAVSPDAKAVAVTTSDGSVHLVDVATLKLVRSSRLPAKSRVMALSRDGNRAVVEQTERDLDTLSMFLAASSSSIVGYSVLDLRSGATVRRETFKRPPLDPADPDADRTPEHAYSTFRISPDGKKAYRYEGGSVTAIDVATGKETELLAPAPSPNPGGFGSFGLRPMARFGSFSPTETFRVQDDGTALVGEEILDLSDGHLVKHAGTGFEAISMNGEHVVTRRDRLFDLSTGGPEVRPGHDDAVTAIAFLPDNRLAAVSGEAIVWKTDNCVERETLDAAATDVASARSKTAVFFGPGAPTLLDDRGQRRRLTLPTGIRLSAISPDGSSLLLGLGDAYKGENKVVLEDVSEAHKQRQLRSVPEPLQGLDISADGQTIVIAVGERFGSNPATLELLSVTDLAPTAKRSVERPGKVLFAGSDTVLHAPEWNGIMVHSASTLAQRGHLHHPSCCTQIAASPDGKLVAGAEGRHFVIWDIASRKRVAALDQVHRQDIHAIAFSPDSRHLATASADTTVLFWDIAKLGMPPLPSRVETPITDPAAAKASFLSRSLDFRISADGSLEPASKGSKNKPPPLKSVTALSSSVGAHCAIAAGKVRCWGTSRGGVLGVPERKGTSKWSAAAIPTPTTVAVTDPVDVQVDTPHACALSRSGDLVCWGQIDFGAPALAPQKVLADVKSFFLFRQRSCAIGTDGLVRCWDAKSPTPTPLPVKDAVALAGGLDHLCVLDKAGVVSCRGENRYDQLGDDTGIDQPDPVPAKGLPAATAISASLHATCALTAAGIHCWGMIGDFLLERPTHLPALDGATAVRTERDQVCALRNDHVDCLDFTRSR